MYSLSAFSRHCLRHIRWLSILLSIGTSSAYGANQTQVIHIISDTPEQRQHQRIIDTLKQRLGQRASINIVSTQQADLRPPSESSCLLSLGTAAFETVQQLPNTCVLSLLIAESRYEKAASHFKKRASAIFINQPIHRITQTTGKLLNDTEQAAIVVSRSWQENLQISDATNTDLYIKRISANDSIVKAFKIASFNADYIIAVPDPEVYNRSNIKNILLTTYKFKVPLIGYSEALSKAGAMISIYTPPELLGIETAEWLLNSRPKKASWPKYFQVKINNKVARSIGAKIQLSEDIINKVWTDE